MAPIVILPKHLSKNHRSRVKLATPDEIEYGTKHIPDYLVWSIINVILGCALFGRTTLAASFKVRRYREERNWIRAQKYSREALRRNIISSVVRLLIVGIIFAVILIVDVNTRSCIVTRFYFHVQ